jgi:hypothetical protein
MSTYEREHRIFGLLSLAMMYFLLILLLDEFGSSPENFSGSLTHEFGSLPQVKQEIKGTRKFQQDTLRMAKHSIGTSIEHTCH